MLPRIPALADAADFWAFTEAGRKLSELHLGYESVEPYPLVVSTRSTTDTSSTDAEALDLRVTKMHFAGKAGAWDKSTIHYNDQITLTGIPAEAHEYLLGSRSAIEPSGNRPGRNSSVLRDRASDTIVRRSPIPAD